MTLRSCVCENGDLLFLVSDGVSDNFHPTRLGVDDVTDAGTWACERMQGVLQGKDLTAPFAVERLLGCCVAVTQASREWHEAGSTGKLPEDYKRFPGKMDHSTCVCVQF
jgi:hypothetical protein